jgi:peptide deformylase
VFNIIPRYISEKEEVQKPIKNGLYKLKIYTYPNPVLRAHTEPIKNISEDIQDLVDNMIEIMYSTPTGIGLAANQVGELKRLIVFDLNPGKEGRKPAALINPEIVISEGETNLEEACLSLIDFSAPITRNAQVKVRGVDRHGNPMDIEAEGLKAICLQHEIDHLDGTLIIDYISSLKRSLYKKRLKNKLKKI